MSEGQGEGAGAQGGGWREPREGSGAGGAGPRGGSTAPAAEGSGPGPRPGSRRGRGERRGCRRAGEPRALTPSPLAPSSYSHALDGMYRVLREGEAVPAVWVSLLRCPSRCRVRAYPGSSLSRERERGRGMPLGLGESRGAQGLTSPHRLAGAGAGQDLAGPGSRHILGGKG